MLFCEITKLRNSEISNYNSCFKTSNKAGLVFRVWEIYASRAIVSCERLSHCELRVDMRVQITLHSEVIKVQIWYSCSFGRSKSINDIVAMETLLPWQQEHP